MIMPSSSPVSRIASMVDWTGIPYRSPAQPSSRVNSSSRRARRRPMSAAVCRAILSTWARVSAGGGRGVDADHAARAILVSEAGDHARVGGAGDRADHDRVEEDAELGLLLGDLARPVGEPEDAEAVLGRAGRDAVRPAAGRAHVLQRALPRVADADVEAGRIELDVRAHDPREQDVADLVVDRVGPVDPLLRDEPGLEPELRRDSGDLTGVVGLVAADRDERVGAD